MKKLKLIAAMLVIAALLPSCQKSIVLSEGEEIIDVKCTIATSFDNCNLTFVKGTFFKTYQEWQDATKDCNMETVLFESGRYNEEFFKTHSLCYYSNITEGGKKYEFINASLKKADSGNILTIYTSCDDKNLLDCSEVFDFFIETDKNIDSVDQVIFKE